jgi:hypothetical protein
MAVEEIFASVDIEGGAGLWVQGTEADELGAMAGRSRNPVVLPQIIEQRKTLLGQNLALVASVASKIALGICSET